MSVDSNGISREGPGTPSEDGGMRIVSVGRYSPDHSLQHSRQRGISDAEELLSQSERNSFADEVTKAFRYIAAPVTDGDEHTSRIREHDGSVAGWPQTLGSRRRLLWMDLFTVSATLPFFALTGIAIWLDKEEESGWMQTAVANCTMVVCNFEIDGLASTNDCTGCHYVPHHLFNGSRSSGI